jgi:hypothetical protein
MFDHALFASKARQLAFFADGYVALSLSAVDAAGWANHGFTPQEAEPWIAEGFTPARASHWCDQTKFVGGLRHAFTPAEARERDNA